MLKGLEGGEEGEGSGACSVCLSRVIPGGIPSGAEQWDVELSRRRRVVNYNQTRREVGWGTLWNAKRSLNVRADRSASHNCPLKLAVTALGSLSAWYKERKRRSVYTEKVGLKRSIKRRCLSSGLYL